MSEDAARAVPVSCPKCSQAAAGEAAACARCGLVFALWTPGITPMLTPLDDGAEVLWHAVVAAWSDPAAHDAFLKHCSQHGLLAAAGRRYRERSQPDGADPIARKMQDRVLAMATAAFSGSRPLPPEPITRKGWFWVVVCVCMGAGMVAAFTIGRH